MMPYLYGRVDARKYFETLVNVRSHRIMPVLCRHDLRSRQTESNDQSLAGPVGLKP